MDITQLHDRIAAAAQIIADHAPQCEGLGEAGAQLLAEQIVAHVMEASAKVAMLQQEKEMTEAAKAELN